MLINFRFVIKFEKKMHKKKKLREEMGSFEK